MLPVRLIALAAPLLVVLAAPAVPASAAPPPLEAIDVERELDPPRGFTWVDAVGATFFLPDGKHLVVTVHDGAAARLGVIGADGSGFRCLTCDAVPDARAPQAFPDGRRLFLSATLGEGGTSDSQSYVLECAPSLLRCEDRRLLDVTFPIDSLTQPPSAQNREAGIHPSGVYVKWGEVRALEGQRMTIGRLVRRSRDYAVEDPRVMNPAFARDGGLDDLVAGGRFYEAQGYTDGWADGGRVAKYGATTSAGNYDIWELDLVTGKRRQLTHDLDYQENGDYSPDGTRIAYGSGRGLDRMDVFSALERPPLLETVAFAQTGRVGLHNNRRCLNERWLMSRAHGERRGGYAGQPVVLDDGWATRSWSWARDGTRAVLVEDRLRPVNYATGDLHDETRLRIVRFPARRPSRPVTPYVPTSDDLARSTVPADAYTGLALGATTRTVAGPHSGTATVSYAGSFAAGRFEVRYDRYSADGRTVLDGTEGIAVPNPLVASRYSADLTATGERPGTMTADLLLRGRSANGRIRTETGGRVLDRVPTQLDCPGIRQVPLQLTVEQRRALRGGRVAIDVRVRARVPEDDRDRPVAGVRVLAGRRATASSAGRSSRRTFARTDGRGRARLVVGRAGRVRLTTDTDGFRDAAVTTVAGGTR